MATLLKFAAFFIPFLLGLIGALVVIVGAWVSGFDFNTRDQNALFVYIFAVVGFLVCGVLPAGVIIPCMLDMADKKDEM